MINKIIANYLAGGKRLVIPQFGAFIHKEGDGVVVFVPFLKKDDGVLVDLLRKEYGFDEADARGVITEYITQIGSGIAERGSFAIEGVGRLQVDANGIFFLEYAPAPGGMPVSAPPTPVVAPAAAVAAPVAAMPSPAPTANAAAPVTPGSVSGSVSGAASPVGATTRAQEAPASRDAVRQAYYGSQEAAEGASRPVAAPGSSPVQGAARPVQPGQPVQAAQPSRPVQPTQNQPYNQRPVQAQPDPAQPRQPIAQPGAAQPTSRPGHSTLPPLPRPAGSGYAPSGQPPMGGQPPVGGRPPGRPMPPRPRPVKASAGKSDKFMVIAILAAIVALASIVYGVMSSSEGPMIDPMEMPTRHQPAQDSVSQPAAAAPGTQTQAR